MSHLLADIGATNTRCAITDDNGRPTAIRDFKNRDFDHPAALLEHYIADLAPTDRPDAGTLAVAAPIRGDEIEMINIDWQFSINELAKQLSLRDLKVLNDFAALARALPELGGDDLVPIGGGRPLPGKPKAVLGPGTGLGVASLVPDGNHWVIVSGEGGHVTLPAVDAREAEVIDAIRARFGHCSAERLLSGPGLGLLHATLHGGPQRPAAELAELARGGAAGACETFTVFFRLLGTIAANVALTVGAFGGVYIGGGIVPRHRERFIASAFRERFEAKGRYGDYLKSIPTYLIVAKYPTLTGLAAYSAERGPD
ncbi:MAG: glucokinase [Gammaproteobacteria bacterium]|nr:MAG: glucokinase [Gammaproteobacteria bacterium]